MLLPVYDLVSVTLHWLSHWAEGALCGVKLGRRIPPTRGVTARGGEGESHEVEIVSLCFIVRGDDKKKKGEDVFACSSSSGGGGGRCTHPADSICFITSIPPSSPPVLRDRPRRGEQQRTLDTRRDTHKFLDQRRHTHQACELNLERATPTLARFLRDDIMLLCSVDPRPHW